MSGTRRSFLQLAAAATLPLRAVSQTRSGGTQPWYLRTYRWGQTNITEKDPVQYDIAWWREYWKRTEVQGVIINAGGIVAYYPSKFPLHHRAQFLNGRDLYSDLAKAAHQDGLAVMARENSIPRCRQRNQDILRLTTSDRELGADLPAQLLESLLFR